MSDSETRSERHVVAERHCSVCGIEVGKVTAGHPGIVNMKFERNAECAAPILNYYRCYRHPES